METKRLGNLGELKALAKFAEYAIPVYVPYGEAEKIDFIAQFDNKLNRIQVKSAENIIDDKIKFGLRSTAINTVKSKTHIYNDAEIDYFVLYCKQNDSLYILSIQEAPATEACLRVVAPKSNQTKNIRMANDYLLDSFLQNLVNNQK